MPHTPNSPATTLRTSIEEILTAEFGTEGLAVKSSQLHLNEGTEGHIAGTSPESIEEWGNVSVGVTTIRVQVYRFWDEEIGTDEHSTVDPAPIEAWADRFQQAVDEASGLPVGGSTSEAWYYRVIRITFPDDPTGNKTRFEATVQGYGQNRGLSETH